MKENYEHQQSSSPILVMIPRFGVASRSGENLKDETNETNLNERRKTSYSHISNGVHAQAARGSCYPKYRQKQRE